MWQFSLQTCRLQARILVLLPVQLDPVPLLVVDRLKFWRSVLPIDTQYIFVVLRIVKSILRLVRFYFFESSRLRSQLLIGVFTQNPSSVGVSVGPLPLLQDFFQFGFILGWVYHHSGVSVGRRILSRFFKQISTLLIFIFGHFFSSLKIFLMNDVVSI